MPILQTWNNRAHARSQNLPLTKSKQFGHFLVHIRKIIFIKVNLNTQIAFFDPCEFASSLQHFRLFKLLQFFLCAWTNSPGNKMLYVAVCSSNNAYNRPPPQSCMQECLLEQLRKTFPCRERSRITLKNWWFLPFENSPFVFVHWCLLNERCFQIDFLACT